MKKQIMWESQHYEFDNSGKIIKHEDAPGTASISDDEFGLTEQIDGELSAQVIPSMVHTPFGLFQVEDGVNPLRQFQLWLGHTNFTITKEIKDIIEQIDGVEVLLIFTRYRFFIAVGEMFDFRDVRVAIEKSICGEIEQDVNLPEDVLLEVNQTIEYLQNNNIQEWCIYVFPNGKIDTAFGEDYLNKMALFKQSVESCGGVIIDNDYQ